MLCEVSNVGLFVVIFLTVNTIEIRSNYKFSNLILSRFST